MFKLAKILNSSTTAPELIRRKTMANQKYKRGMLMKITAQGEVKSLPDGEKPTHICCENLKAGESATVLCYEILDSMIFTAIAYCDMRGVTPGVKVILAPDDDGRPSYITSDSESGYVTVYDTCGAEKYGDTVLVRFI